MPGSSANTTYKITCMARGGYRFECYKQNCGAWSDHLTEEAAEKAKSAHQQEHRRSAARRRKRAAQYQVDPDTTHRVTVFWGDDTVKLDCMDTSCAWGVVLRDCGDREEQETWGEVVREVESHHALLISPVIYCSSDEEEGTPTS